jgi:hypothetical protein
MQNPPSEFAGRDRAELRRHLAKYWKMEAGNVLLIPAMGCAMLWSGDTTPDAAAIAGMAPCSLLLVIGAAAWRLALAGLDGDTALADKLTAACAWAEWPSLAVLVVATALAVASVVADGWRPNSFAAAGFTLMGWLEYANYYHVQLQNFDSPIDLKRLKAGPCGRGGRGAAAEPALLSAAGRVRRARRGSRC